jgi:hypothetical protein
MAKHVFGPIQDLWLLFLSVDMILIGYIVGRCHEASIHRRIRRFTFLAELRNSEKREAGPQWDLTFTCTVART